MTKNFHPEFIKDIYSSIIFLKKLILKIQKTWAGTSQKRYINANKKFLTSLVIREKEIKSTEKCLYTLTRMAISNKSDGSEC